MTESGATERLRVADVIQKYGRCLELVPMDPHFHDVSVGLYVKDGTCTVWTFSRKPGVRQRIRKIRDQIVALGGLVPVEGTQDQARWSCGYFHVRPAKLLIAEAVSKSPGYAPAQGEMSLRDTRTDLIFSVAGREEDGRWVYQISGEGEAPNIPMRLRAMVTGFARYGEMEKVSDTEMTFPCGRRHDMLRRMT